jgi:hypothetical protein
LYSIFGHLLNRYFSSPSSLFYFTLTNGVYSDLTFADEGNSAMTGGLINFAKYRRVGGLIREVMHLKSGTYSLTPVEEVQKYVLKYEVQT